MQIMYSIGSEPSPSHAYHVYHEHDHHLTDAHTAAGLCLLKEATVMYVHCTAQHVQDFLKAMTNMQDFS